MNNSASTITPMAKTENIMIRVSPEVKAAIQEAAAKKGMTVSNWLVWAAAHQERVVGIAAGLIFGESND